MHRDKCPCLTTVIKVTVEVNRVETGIFCLGKLSPVRSALTLSEDGVVVYGADWTEAAERAQAGTEVTAAAILPALTGEILAANKFAAN